MKYTWFYVFEHYDSYKMSTQSLKIDGVWMFQVHSFFIWDLRFERLWNLQKLKILRMLRDW